MSRKEKTVSSGVPISMTEQLPSPDVLLFDPAFRSPLLLYAEIFEEVGELHHTVVHLFLSLAFHSSLRKGLLLSVALPSLVALPPSFLGFPIILRFEVI